MQMESGYTGGGRKETLVLAGIAIFLAALLLRFVGLGSRFLLPGESALAVASLGVARGSGITSLVPWPGDALFFGLNAATFFVGATSNFWARFWPALFGTAMVVLPFFLPVQDQREKWRNVIFAALIAISPSFVFWSRRLDGSIGAAFGALLFLVFLFREGRFSHYVAGVGLALVLLSGRSGMPYLVSIGVVGAWMLAQRDRGSLRAKLVSDLPALILPLVVVYALVSTVGFTFLPGFGMAANGVAEWFGAFFKPGHIPWWWPALHLLLDEPLILLLAFVSFFDEEFWGRTKPALLLSWSFVALMLMLWQIGRSAGDLLAVLLPLAWIGAEALSRVVTSSDFRTRVLDWAYSAPALVTEIVLFFYLGITLAMYTQLGKPTVLLLSLAGVLILASVVLLSYTYVGLRGALQGFLVSLLVILTLYSVHLAVGLSIERNPLRYEAYLPQSVSADFQAFLDQVRAESFHKVGDDRLISIDVVDVRPEVRWVLLWALRDFDNTRFLDTLPRSPARIVVTPDSKTWIEQVHGYSGQEIAVLVNWSPAGVRGAQLLRWIQLRERGDPDSVSKVALWVAPK